MSQKQLSPEMQQQVQAVNDSLDNRLYIPAFVKAAEARNVPINSQEDLSDLIELAQTLRSYETQPAAGGQYKQALALLKNEKQAQAQPQNPYALPQGAMDGFIQSVAADPEFVKLAAASLQLELAAAE